MANVLTAREGYVYTNGETFSTVIRLGVNDSADNWHEITEEEAEKLQNEETETPTETEATEIEQKAQAYDILMGVSE
jgi:hypothetical protein